MVSLESLMARWEHFCSNYPTNAIFLTSKVSLLPLYYMNIYIICLREGMTVDITSLAQEVYEILSARANAIPRTAQQERRKKSQFFINSSNNKSKSVTLHIQGLDSTVSGLVSVLIETLWPIETWWPI